MRARLRSGLCGHVRPGRRWSIYAVVVIGLVFFGIESSAGQVMPAKADLVRITENVLEFDETISVKVSSVIRGNGRSDANVVQHLPVDRCLEEVGQAKFLLSAKDHPGGAISSLKPVVRLFRQSDNTGR